MSDLSPEDRAWLIKVGQIKPEEVKAPKAPVAKEEE